LPSVSTCNPVKTMRQLIVTYIQTNSSVIWTMVKRLVSLAFGPAQWYAQATLPIVNTMVKIAQHQFVAKKRLKQKVSLAARFLKTLYIQKRDLSQSLFCVYVLFLSLSYKTSVEYNP